jgi:hypothetical protein
MTKDGQPSDQQGKTQDIDPAMEHQIEMTADLGGGAQKAETGLTPEAQDQIGRQLRRVYQEMLSDPLPDRFSKLLDALSKKKEDPSQ